MKKKQPTYGGKRRIRKDDLVVVLTGKDRGAQGKVLRVIPDKGRAIVEGVNKIKRATRANPQKNIKGGILEREAPIAISNLMLVDPEGGKPTRVGIRKEGGEWVRYAKRSGTTIGTLRTAGEQP
ncbi:MAG TPA: 50S ribosomal protein L24 [Thermoanaerobaculia bacterium]|nr:50S ribosomal protein L24 [Thermoanaerobaculia bacterium]